MRILLVATDKIAPGPTGSGNQAIRWGLIKGLAQAAAVPAFFSAADATGREALFSAAREGLGLADGRFWFGQSRAGAGGSAALSGALASFRPDAVLAYGPDALTLVREARTQVPVGIMSVDLEHVPILERHLYNLRYGRLKQKVKSTLLTPSQLAFAWRTRREVLAAYPLADFIVNHAHHHAAWHARTHGRPVLYTPNPVADLDSPPVRRPARPPRFALLGGIGGIATLTGLAWFATGVHDRLVPVIDAGELEVHLIGKGELDPSIDRRMTHVIRRGFVDDLTAEMAQVTALLVPTPIDLGFRTRIVDGFRHGVPAVAHEANRLGMPELSDGRNSLVANDPAGFADAVLRLARDPGLSSRLGEQALADFSEALSADMSARRIVGFIERILTEGARVAG